MRFNDTMATANHRIKDAATLLGVSDDTIRRWITDGRLHANLDASGRKVVDGVALAQLAVELANAPQQPGRESARNHFPGLVTRVVTDGVMAQVEIQSGPHRIVSLISREAADELGLEPGVLATAQVKATNVVVELRR